MTPNEEALAFLATLGQTAPYAPTACKEWTAHELIAHLTAGAKELADLIEEKLAGVPPRATQSFAVREAPFRAMEDDELRTALIEQNLRRMAAYDALLPCGDPVIEFTGRSMTADELARHSRSEATLHRWDLSGELLSDALPELTAHAVTLLNTMPLDEVVRPATSVALTTGDDTVVVSSAGYAWGATGDAAIVCETDPATRLLLLWGRRPAEARIDDAVTRLLAGRAVPWPV